MLSWLLEQGATASPEVLVAAAVGGLDSLQLALRAAEKEYPNGLDPLIVSGAARGGHLDIVRQGGSNGMWDLWAYAEAARAGRLDVLMELHDGGCPTSVNTEYKYTLPYHISPTVDDVMAARRRALPTAAAQPHGAGCRLAHASTARSWRWRRPTRSCTRSRGSNKAHCRSSNSHTRTRPNHYDNFVTHSQSSKSQTNLLTASDGILESE